jgi:hypothetical protein
VAGRHGFELEAFRRREPPAEILSEVEGPGESWEGISPSAEAKVAGRQGFEPRYADPESAVLPLDDLPENTFPSADSL